MRTNTTETNLPYIRILGRVALGKKNTENLIGPNCVGFWLSD